MKLESILQKGSVGAAQELIGWRFYRVEADGTRTGGTIIETEAYTQEDAASHSNKGETPRTKIMFGPAGYLYVYFTYGMHWCVNIVTGRQGEGEAVLIRALEPDEGLDKIREQRNFRPNKELTNGPAKVCQALGINGENNGQRLNGGEFLLLEPVEQLKTQATTRIGITQDTHRLWRFIKL